MKRNLSLTLLLAACCIPALHAEETTMLPDTEKSKLISPFPEAQQDFVRHAIFLPKAENESSLKIELAVGKTLEVDCNRHHFIGKLEEKNLDGWGYTYYELNKIDGPASTMMACLNPEKTTQFITIPSDKLIRYNSKLPIVIYTPKDVAVKYRVWSASQNWEETK